MATPTKTIQTALLALQSVASGAVVISSVLDLSTVFEVSLGIRFGRRAATALTVPCVFRVEVSFVAFGDRNWIPLFTVASDAPCPLSAKFTLKMSYAEGTGPKTLTFEVPIGQTSITVS